MLAGCHDRWHYWSVIDASAPLPSEDQVDRLGQRAAMPAEPLDIDVNGDQTVLIAAMIHDDPNKTDDERGYTFVAVIDGPPKRGKYEITPENGRFIEHSKWKPPRRPYRGAEGTVRIYRVKGNTVIARCNLRNSYVLGEPRHVFRGQREFRMVRDNTRLLNLAGIRLLQSVDMGEKPQ
jgi:hypothetical protein